MRVTVVTGKCNSMESYVDTGLFFLNLIKQPHSVLSSLFLLFESYIECLVQFHFILIPIMFQVSLVSLHILMLWQ